MSTNYSVLSATPAKHQHHRLVSRNNGSICLSSFDGPGKNPDYSFVHGDVYGLPAELYYDEWANTERWTFRYKIIDSYGQYTKGKIRYNKNTSPGLPEFIFVAAHNLHYTICCSFSLDNGFNKTRAKSVAMLAPWYNDCGSDDQNDWSEDTADNQDYHDEAKLDKELDDYHRDNYTDPLVNEKRKARLDKELDDYHGDNDCSNN